MTQKKAVTFNDIAEYTHFSKTTISRYFNRPDSVTPANQEKIREALEALGYHENKVARILAKGKTELIGVILPNLSLHYFSNMLNQILSTNIDNGYKFLVVLGEEDIERERANIMELISYQVEGLIVMNHVLPSEELAALGVPVVSIEREDTHISSVNCDNYMGAVQAVSLLARNKCDILIHVNTPTEEHLPAYQRITGFRDFCEEHNIPNRMFILTMGHTYESMRPVMEKLLDELEAEYKGKKVGMFFSDDTRANCFLNVLIHRYHGFPKNYQIVGFDNSPIAQEATCPLTTVGQQVPVIAATAVELLKNQIEFRRTHPGEPCEAVHKIITPVLIRRSTTA